MVVRPQGGLARAESGQWRFGVGRDRGTSGWPGTTVRHDRSDPDPLGDRAGRPAGRRATAPAGLRRAAQAGRAEAGSGEAGADPPGHGPGPRGLSAAGRSRRPSFLEDRGHFFAAAAQAMRRILVDNARRKRAQKRGDGLRRQPLEAVAAPEIDEELLALDEALQKLAEAEPIKARLVELRYFAGLTGEQAAKVLGISPGDGRPPLGLRQGLAAERGPRPVIPRPSGSFREFRDAFAGPFCASALGNHGVGARRTSMNDESLFHLALEKPAAERSAFLEQACAGDDALRHVWKPCFGPTRPRTASWSDRRRTPRRRPIRAQPDRRR